VLGATLIGYGEQDLLRQLALLGRGPSRHQCCDLGPANNLLGDRRPGEERASPAAWTDEDEVGLLTADQGSDLLRRGAMPGPDLDNEAGALESLAYLVCSPHRRHQLPLSQVADGIPNGGPVRLE
jgi:hypothetical protein